MKATRRTTTARTCPATRVTPVRVLASFLVHLLVLVFTTSAGAGRVANGNVCDGLQLQSTAHGAIGSLAATHAATRAHARKDVARTTTVSLSPGARPLIDGYRPRSPFGDDPPGRGHAASGRHALGAFAATSAIPLVGPADLVALLVVFPSLHEPRAACADPHRARGPPLAT